MTLVPQEAGRILYRVMGIIYLTLAVLALFAYRASQQINSLETSLLALFVVLLLGFAIVIFRSTQQPKGFFYYSSLAVGILSILLASWPYAPATSLAMSLLYPLNFLASAALLGSVLMGMTLGHWYLAARMPIASLKRIVQVIIISALANGFLLGLTMAVFGDVPGNIEDPRNLVFALGRVIFGILAPLVLGAMAWDVLRWRKTTSATGILYVALAVVLAGQLSARYLLISTGLPW